jgi:hypothetical protein
MDIKKIKPFLLALLLGLGAYMLYDTASQPGVQDLSGGFEEVAFYRNENNTGPIIRIYAVTVSDTLWEEMKAYGDFMPHTKYGTTRVHFFAPHGPVPQELFPGAKNFEDRFLPDLLATYDKDAMGQISFRKGARSQTFRE